MAEAIRGYIELSAIVANHESVYNGLQELNDPKEHGDYLDFVLNYRQNLLKSHNNQKK